MKPPGQNPPVNTPLDKTPRRTKPPVDKTPYQNPLPKPPYQNPPTKTNLPKPPRQNAPDKTSPPKPLRPKHPEQKPLGQITTIKKLLLFYPPDKIPLQNPLPTPPPLKPAEQNNSTFTKSTGQITPKQEKQNK